MGSPEVDAHHYIPMAVRTAQTSANGQTIAYSIMPMNSGKDYKARETDVAQPLMAGGPVGGNQGGDFIAQAVAYAIQERAVSLNLEAGPQGSGFRDDNTACTLESRSQVQAVVCAVQERAVGVDTYNGIVTGDVAATFGAASGGSNQSGPKILQPTGAHPPAIAFSAKDYGGDAGPLAPTLRSGNHNTSHANGGVMPAVAYDMRGREGGAQFEGPHDTANIRAASGGSSRSFVASYAVRRLTPVECERLQGFPDNFTDIPWRKKPAGECPDGPRYKALGNSMAVPVMRWIGERIQLIDDLLTLI
jgi:DNA (cytosine-5)-methyltransferase 1